jgi:2'-5' RNA ligase
VDSEQIHLTLRFIGDTDSTVFKDVREALTEVHCEPFSMQLEGVGFFPPRGKPRVVWVGVRKNQLLLQLHNRVESVLVRAGFAPEGRKYSPHITLARLKNTPVSKVGDYLTHYSMFMTEEFQVNEFLLYSSVLNSKGAKHYVEDGYLLNRGL